ncbi:MAG: hypothetical protein JWQ01_1138 [Massilia sp.]|nr:hypothetical protein [Massilia sp.]
MPKPGQLYMYMRSDKDAYSEEWVLCLGRIALNFAKLEGCAIWLIDKIGTDAEKTALRAKQSFAHRNELAILLVPYKGLPADIVNDWVQLLGELNAAAGMRNKIFHNPSSVANGKNFEENDGIVLLKQGEDIVLGLGDVQEYQNHLILLTQRMHILLDRTVVVSAPANETESKA